MLIRWQQAFPSQPTRSSEASYYAWPAAATHFCGSTWLEEEVSYLSSPYATFTRLHTWPDTTTV